MATVDSTQIANLESDTREPSHRFGGVVRQVASTASPAANQAQNDIIRFVRVPSNARISALRISAADATTAGSIDIGIYETVENGGAAVDSDLFASALDLAGGPFNNSDQTFESGQYSLAEAQTALWQVLGLTEDPNKYYDVASLITVAFNGGPTSILLQVDYVE